jgi:hypothetical protein
MDMAKLIAALAPAFAAGFALQRLLEILDPILDRIKNSENKKIVLGLISFAAGLGLASWPKIRVLTQLVAPDTAPPILDYLVTALIVSGGTEGFNSIMKFLSAKKEETKAAAVEASATALNSVALSQRIASKEDSLTMIENDDFSLGDAQRCAHDCATDVGKTIEFDPSNTLGDYGLITPEQFSLYRKDVRTNGSFGLASFRRTINPNALKDISGSNTILEVGNILKEFSTPLDV